MSAGASDGNAARLAQAKPADGEAEPGDSRDLILKVLGAIGTGLGILGFVTFFGGAIVWVRAKEAHLPANDVVSVTPSSVLVTTGASFLVPAVLIAVLAVAVIFIVHLGFDLPRRLRKRNAFEHARLLHRKAERKGREAEDRMAIAKAARALAGRRSEIGECALREEQRALDLMSVAADRRSEGETAQARAEVQVERSPRQLAIELVAGAVTLVVLPPVLNGAIAHVGLLHGAILAVVALVAALVSLVAYVATGRFAWFGVVAFATVGIYIGFATYFSTVGNPKVEPAAALRSTHPPALGSFIADTTGNLYLGSLPEGEGPSRLIVIPRAQVTDLAVGPLLSPEAARRRAIALAHKLCRQEIVDAAGKGEAAGSPKPACSERQLATLPALLD